MYVPLPKFKSLSTLTSIPPYPPRLLCNLSPWQSHTAVHVHELLFFSLSFFLNPFSLPTQPRNACPTAAVSLLFKRQLISKPLQICSLFYPKFSALLPLMHFTHLPLLKHNWIISKFALPQCISKIFHFSTKGTELVTQVKLHAIVSLELNY